jgi:ArsR family transcriptional regulator, lead/cadmium/zinc/bismuth-responsive transcriptional repressor
MKTARPDSTHAVTISPDEERLIRALQILGDTTRYKIFKLLLMGKELCVTEIASELTITLSAVSQHFRNFEMAGLVNKERTGQKICYYLKTDDPIVKELIRIASVSTKKGIS